MPNAITPLSSSRFTRALAAVAAFAVVVTGLTVGGVAPTADAATGTVTGTVFRDFNSNGVLNTGAAARSGVANDLGLAGVTVRAYDRDNVLRGTATSGANGTYTLTATNTATDALRVEFSGLPAGYQPSAAGTSNGTTIQFTSVGATGVNLGVNAPEDYSKSAAPVVTAIQYSGLPASSASNPAVVATPYSTNYLSSAKPAAGVYPNRVTLATFGQVGAVWGTAFRAKSNALFVSATYKRQSGLGALGLGGIYRVSNATVTTGTGSTAVTTGNSAATVSNWLDVTTLGINVGTAQTNAARGLAGPAAPAADVDAFAKAGKVGIGGIALSPDGDTLYFVNLFDKKIYALDLTTATPTLKSTIDLGLTTGQRPWALNIYRDQLYVGYVTTGETGTAETANPGQAAAAAGVSARVISAPLSNTSSWTTVLNSPLDYVKGDVYNNTLATQAHRWNTWTDTWDWAAYTSPSGAIAAGSVGENATGGWQIYPQPVLSGLYFDGGGFLSLGFADRTGIQGGNRNYAARAGATSGSYETGSSGDLLIAAPQANGTFTLERNGSASTNTTPVVTRTSTRATNAQGPGTGEFYNDSLNASGAGGTHQEVALGSLAGIRGTGEVISTEYDPLDGIRLAGIGWLSTANGNGIAGYEQTQDPGTGTPSTLGTFQKGGGLGSVQLLAEQAPIEIGNRAWFDADQDGIQDADEPALPGVTVQLLQGTTVVATRTTDANGNYYFSSDSASANYAGAAFTPNGGDYTVKFTTPTTGSVTFSSADAALYGAVPWSSVSLTARAAGTDTSVDSNPNTATGEYTYTAGAPGVDDHTIDAGYKASASYTVEKLISASGGSPTSGQEFSISTSATDFRGASYSLGTNASTTLSANQKSSPVSVPAGTRVQVSETGTSAYRSATVTPSTATLVTVGTPFAFTVTNELHKPGQFSIKKAVTGTAASAVASTQQFTVKYTYPGLATPGTLTVKNDGVVVTSTAIPFGTVVTLSEDAPTGAPASVKWNTPTWAGTGITDNGNGTASLTIGDDTTIAATLTNPTTLVTGNFSVTKVIGSDAASSVPGNFEFTVQYSINGGTSWTDLVVTKNNPTATVTGVPAGTQVLIREVAPGSAASDVEFGTPVFSGTGVTNASPNSSFTIPADTTRAVTLTNPTTRLYGTFSVTKSVTGGAKSQVTAGKKFTVNYTYSGQSTTGSYQVADGEVFSSESIPRGTVVTITEVTPTGGLPTGSSWGTPVLKIGSSTLSNGSTITIGDGILAVTLENPTSVTAAVDIEKGDGTGTAISHDADTMADAQYYAPGATKTIVFRVTNSGTDALRQVALSDAAISGGTVTGLTWTLPNGTVLTAAPGVATQWAGTFGTGTETFKPGEVITGEATLVVGASQQPHVDRASVSATGVNSGTAVGDSDNYNALSGSVQVIKYDGEKADPAVKDASGNWITPSKPGMAASQNADTSANAVEYPVDTAKKVRWVVTNTGTTMLTNLTLADVTNSGPSIGSNWTADLTPIGGPADYNFATSGPYAGIFAPGASFFAEGTLTLPASSTHRDTVTVVGSIVEPAVDNNGVPTGAPKLSGAGDPVVLTDGTGSARTATDFDVFHAKAGVGPFIDIEKGDGTGTAIAHDADLMSDGQAYTAGDSRTIVFRVTNTGDENLRNVVLRDEAISGSRVTDLEWTLPDGTVLTAVAGTPTQWAGTFGTGTATFKPGDVITGKAKLTVAAADKPHVDRASVTAVGAGSGKTVADADAYNAFTADIQVIKYDGQKADPAVKNASGDWIIPSKSAMDAAQDADTTSAAVDYPVDLARKVRWVVTNTGTTSLTNLTLEDVTGDGPDIGDDWTADLSQVGGVAGYSFVDDGPWTGTLAPGESFFAEGTLTLPASDTHTDTVTVVGEIVVPAVDAATGVPTGLPSLDAAGDPIVATDASGDPVTVTDADKFNAKTGIGAFIEIQKGDGTGTTIDHNANSIDGAQFYTLGETRTIVLRVENTGDEALREVTLADTGISGGTVTSLEWTLPNGTVLPATVGTPTKWAGTFGAGTETLEPGEVITGKATLVVALADQPHVDRASVTAVGVGSGKAVEDSNDYNAFTGGIQVIKYDGEKADPAVKNAAGDWITPSKAAMDAAQDADTADAAVVYPVDTAKKVRWVVTNTGTTTLTNLTLDDVTNDGPSIAGDWTADLSPIGGPADYSFADDGTWAGAFAPGESFFAEGTLELGAIDTHADTVTVVGDVVTPAVDNNGAPTGDPGVDTNGDLVLALDASGDPITVTDNDPFNAKTGRGPAVDIEKGDGTGTTITNDADTMMKGQLYTPGSSRTIVFRVTNTGDENLREVELTDETLSGAKVSDLTWTFPDGSTAKATLVGGKLSATWAATVTGTTQWLPGQVITGTATLTVSLSDEPHVDTATVTAVGADSDKDVSDTDNYNAYTGGIQVIKYDGGQNDPTVKTQGGDWIMPSKKSFDPKVDADTRDTAVVVQPNGKQKVRWVVTNIGTTYLTSVDLADITNLGPSVGDTWTADLSGIGGPSNYSFVTSGTWHGLFAPGESFFAEGELTMGQLDAHADIVKVVAKVVVPDVDPITGVPTGAPTVDPTGAPIVGQNGDGTPYTVNDDDPFTAVTPSLAEQAEGTLPFTGVEIQGSLLLALMLLVGGGLLMIVVPRRRRKH